MTNRLHTLTALDESVTVYVPTTQGTRGAASEFNIECAKAHVAMQFAETFGGYTITEGTGGYQAEDGELVEEKVFMVRANTNGLTDAQIDIAVAEAEYVRWFMQQECVSLEVNGKLYFV